MKNGKNIFLYIATFFFNWLFSFLHFPLPLSHVKLFPPSAGSGSRLIYTPRFMSSYPRSPVRGTRFRVMMHSERSLFRYCFFFFYYCSFFIFLEKELGTFLNICRSLKHLLYCPTDVINFLFLFKFS